MKTRSIIAKLSLSVLIAVVGGRQTGATTLVQYPFDSLTGQTAEDISGYGHNATFDVGPTVALNTDNPFGEAGNQSVALSVNPTLAHIANPATIDFTVNGKFTLEGWLKPAAYQDMTLLQLGHSSGDYSYVLGMAVSGAPVALTYDIVNGYHSFAGPTALTLNTWHHLALEYDGTALRLFVDAVEVNNVTGPVGFTNALNYGQMGGYGFYGQVNGLMDDIRISNTALAPAELGFAESFIPEPSSLTLLALGGVAWWARRRNG